MGGAQASPASGPLIAPVQRQGQNNQLSVALVALGFYSAWLFSTGNYACDVLNFTLAQQRLRDLLECGWPAALEVTRHPLDSLTWRAAMTVGRCDPAHIRRLGFARFARAVARELDPHTHLLAPLAGEDERFHATLLWRSRLCAVGAAGKAEGHDPVS